MIELPRQLSLEQRSPFRDLAELKMESAFEGSFPLGNDLSMAVSNEPNNWIRCKIPFNEHLQSVRNLLEENSWMPGNLRYATENQGQATLVADIPFGDPIRTTRSLNDIRQWVQARLDFGDDTHSDSDSNISTETIRQGLNEAGWDTSQVIEIDRGESQVEWEVRPNVDGNAIAIHVAQSQDAIRIFKTVLSQVPNDIDILGDHALWLNQRLRFCRLSIVQDQLAVESTLSAGVMGSKWIATAVQAVAVASLHCTEILRILADKDPAVSEFYDAMILSTNTV